MKTPSLQEFKKWSREHYQMAHTVAMSMAYAQCKREEVDAYIRPVFEMFDFYVSEEFATRRGIEKERITKPRDLYLSDQAELLKEYYTACDAEHRKHGFDGPVGHCPALCAEHLQIQAENALLMAGAELFGIEDCAIYGDTRKKMLDLLMGACLKKEAA